MEGRVNSDREQVLRAVLNIWAGILDGAEEDLTRAETRDRLFATVGSHLFNKSGGPCRAAVLRSHLRVWLRPRNGQITDAHEAFKVSWGLTRRRDAIAAWGRAGSPRRTDPTPHLAAAVGWDRNEPATPGSLSYPYLPAGELHPGPGGAAASLVDAAVHHVLDSDAPFGAARQSRLGSDIRTWMTPGGADGIHLFDRMSAATDAAPTVEVTRLAFITSVGVALRHMLDQLLDPLSDADTPILELAEDVIPRWSNPPELAELRKACESAGSSSGKASPDLADIRTAFEVFATNVRRLTPRRFPAMRVGPDRALAARRLSVLVELAVADVRASHDVPQLVFDKVAALVRTAVDIISEPGATAEMLEFQRRLNETVPQQVRLRAESPTALTSLHTLLTRLASDGRRGKPPPIRADAPADLREVSRLVDVARTYLTGGRDRPEQILSKLATAMPSVVTALVSGDLSDLEYRPERARWWLFEAAGDALHKRPDSVESVIVGSAFADLGWAVANEHSPEEVRHVTEQVLWELRAVRNSDIERDMWGVLTRVMRGRPLADSKSANFAQAQLMADQSVRYGSHALYSAMGAAGSTASQIVQPLAGLQLSLLQASGVYIRSAETEIIVPQSPGNPDKRRRHGDYIRVLTATSSAYIDLAIARLDDLKHVVKAKLLTAEEVNLPPTAPASTAMMGMRTILLASTLEHAYSRGRKGGTRELLPSIPDQFRRMLELENLSKLNFADMTRLAMHYTFLTNDPVHPARDCRRPHADTPPHLKPARGALDLVACGNYLKENNFDTGILDVIQIKVLRRVLDGASDGRYSEWLRDYNNPTKRTAGRFRRGDVDVDPLRLRDSIVGW